MPKSSLPSVDQPAKKQDSQQGQAVEKPEEFKGYLPRRVDVKLTREQALVLRDKTRLLQDCGARTQDGRFVTDRTKAIVWILENEVQL